MEGGVFLRYTPEEEINEILRRSKVIFLRRERRKVQMYECMTGVCALLLLVALVLLPDDSLVTTKKTVYGSFLLAKESGGYVLVALIAFIVGIAVAYFCIKYRKQNDLGEDEEDND